MDCPAREKSSLSLSSTKSASDISDCGGADSFPTVNCTQPPPPNPRQLRLRYGAKLPSDSPKPLTLIALTVNASLRSLNVDAGAAQAQPK